MSGYNVLMVYVAEVFMVPGSKSHTSRLISDIISLDVNIICCKKCLIIYTFFIENNMWKISKF